jgi:hypothetical protein
MFFLRVDGVEDSYTTVKIFLKHAFGAKSALSLVDISYEERVNHYLPVNIHTSQLIDSAFFFNSIKTRGACYPTVDLRHYVTNYIMSNRLHFSSSSSRRKKIKTNYSKKKKIHV